MEGEGAFSTTRFRFALGLVTDHTGDRPSVVIKCDRVQRNGVKCPNKVSEHEMFQLIEI